MGKFRELVPYTISVTSTAKSIGDFIDDTQSNKKELQSISYVEICAYQDDGDTVRGAIDLVWHPGTASEQIQPVLAGQPKVFDGMTWGAANCVYLKAAGTTEVVLLVGYE